LLKGSFSEQGDSAGAENFPEMIAVFNQILHEDMLTHEKKNGQCRRVEDNSEEELRDTGMQETQVFRLEEDAH